MSLFSYGTSTEFEAQWYGIPDPTTINYLQAEQQRLQTNLVPFSAGMFKNMADSVYKTLNYEEMLRTARAFTRKISTLFMQNEIQPLQTMAELQHAPLVMQRWLMAEPLTRQMWLDQKIDGYSDTYRSEDKTVGMNNTDYCKVIDGLYLEDANGDLVMHNIYGLYDDDHPNTRPLDITEQIDILDSWALLRTHFKMGKEDPTSKYNSML